MEKIEKKITINAPVSKVWEALTDKDKLNEWMLMTTTFEPVSGKEFTFKSEPMENWDGYIYCKVVEIEVNKKLVYTWNAEFINAETLVTILISEKGNSTEITLIHTGWEKVPAESRTERTQAHNKGWDLRFVQKLKEVLEK